VIYESNPEGFKKFRQLVTNSNMDESMKGPVPPADPLPNLVLRPARRTISPWNNQAYPHQGVMVEKTDRQRNRRLGKMSSPAHGYPHVSGGLWKNDGQSLGVIACLIRGW
jgi:hypothetical protein